MSYFTQHIQDFKDLGIVNGVSFGTVGVSKMDIVAMNELIQSTGNSILVLLAVGYTAFKCYRMLRDMKWDKQDRENELNDN